MDMVNIILFIVLAAVAVLLAFAVVHLAQSRRHEERLLNSSAHTLARLIASKTRLSRLLGSSLLSTAFMFCVVSTAFAAGGSTVVNPTRAAQQEGSARIYRIDGTPADNTSNGIVIANGRKVINHSR